MPLLLEFFHFYLFFIIGYSVIQFVWLIKFEEDPSVPLRKKVAVCIGGQLERWQPSFFIHNAIHYNPSYDFYLFHNFQKNNNNHSNNHTTNRSIYNTDKHLVYEPSPMLFKTKKESLDYVWHLYYEKNPTSSNTGYPYNLKSTWLHYHHYLTEHEIAKTFHLHRPFDRIGTFIPQQNTILNMYHHQVICIDQIKNFEMFHNLTIDYIISTREDVYFWLPMNLTYLFQKVDLPENIFLREKKEDLNLNLNLNQTEIPERECDILAKHCLAWSGINMRLQIYHRDAGIQMLSNRFHYYRHMQQMNLTVDYPEEFEKFEAEYFGYRPCALILRDLPVTAVRHTENWNFCFLYFEYHKCTIPERGHFLRAHICKETSKKRLL